MFLGTGILGDWYGMVKNPPTYSLQSPGVVVGGDRNREVLETLGIGESTPLQKSKLIIHQVTATGGDGGGKRLQGDISCSPPVCLSCLLAFSLSDDGNPQCHAQEPCEASQTGGNDIIFVSYFEVYLL